MSDGPATDDAPDGSGSVGCGVVVEPRRNEPPPPAAPTTAPGSSTPCATSRARRGARTGSATASNPRTPGPGCVPGACKGKAHRPSHLGYGGRRVLASRKWTGKDLADHRHDRKAHVLRVLGRLDELAALERGDHPDGQDRRRLGTRPPHRPRRPARRDPPAPRHRPRRPTTHRLPHRPGGARTRTTEPRRQFGNRPRRTRGLTRRRHRARQPRPAPDRRPGRRTPRHRSPVPPADSSPSDASGSSRSVGYVRIPESAVIEFVTENTVEPRARIRPRWSA